MKLLTILLHSHGAGKEQQTLSDLVYSIEYVDAKGVLREINRNKDGDRLISAASGCFGLLGVVTHITLVLDEMSCAVMKPEKKHVFDAIPPPDGVKVPEPLLREQSTEEKEKNVKDFEKRALEAYYAEWFWFPLSNEVWINTWSKAEVNDTADVEEYPSKLQLLRQFFESVAMDAAQRWGEGTKTQQVLPELQTSFICK